MDFEKRSPVPHNLFIRSGHNFEYSFNVLELARPRILFAFVLNEADRPFPTSWGFRGLRCGLNELFSAFYSSRKKSDEFFGWSICLLWCCCCCDVVVVMWCCCCCVVVVVMLLLWCCACCYVVPTVMLLLWCCCFDVVPAVMLLLWCDDVIVVMWCCCCELMMFLLLLLLWCDGLSMEMTAFGLFNCESNWCCLIGNAWSWVFLQTTDRPWSDLPIRDVTNKRFA